MAVPAAGYIGGSYDPVAQTLTVDLSALAEILTGFATVGVTYVAGRYAKANGGAT